MTKGEGGGCGSKEHKDFYGVLGLKECTEVELRSAYKKLALRWHPDQCSASGNMQCVEEAKKIFQDIQGAYSVLSDWNKRFLYDVGVSDKEEDDENGMGDFLNKMAALMQQNKPDGNGGDSFENLQDLFQEIFQAGIAAFSSSTADNHTDPSLTASFSFSVGSYSEFQHKQQRNSADLNFGSYGFNPYFQNFSIGLGEVHGSWMTEASGGTQRKPDSE